LSGRLTEQRHLGVPALPVKLVTGRESFPGMRGTHTHWGRVLVCNSFKRGYNRRHRMVTPKERVDQKEASCPSRVCDGGKTPSENGEYGIRYKMGVYCNHWCVSVIGGGGKGGLSKWGFLGRCVVEGRGGRKRSRPWMQADGMGVGTRSL